MFRRGPLKILDSNTPVRVQGYDPALGAKGYPTISGGVVYVHPHTKVRHHLIFHQAIHMPHLDHHLLCSMQLRAHGVDVNDCPRIYCKNPTDESHAVVAKDEYGGEVILPFYLRGATSYFDTEPLSREEFERHDYIRVEMMSQHMTWDPSSPIYEDQENAMVSGEVDLAARNSTARGPLTVINSITTSSSIGAVDVIADDNFGRVLESKVNVSSTECDRVISEAVSRETNPTSNEDINPELFNESFETEANEMLKNNGDMVSTRRKMVDSATLADRWDIDPLKAKSTIQKTTQRGARTCLDSTLR